MNQQVTLTRQALRTPSAAAVAGIIFAVLFTTSLVLIRHLLARGVGKLFTIGYRRGYSFLHHIR